MATKLLTIGREAVALDGISARVDLDPKEFAEDVKRLQDFANVTIREKLKATGMGKAYLQNLGRRLFEAVFQGEVLEHYRKLLDSQSPFRLALHIEDYELVSLPWEFLYDFRHELFLGASGNTNLCRRLPGVEPGILTPVAAPLLQALLVFSAHDVSLVFG